MRLFILIQKNNGEESNQKIKSLVQSNVAQSPPQHGRRVLDIGNQG